MSTTDQHIVPDTGIPHFKGIVKQARASGYTFDKAINDIIDNVIFKTSKLIVNLQFDVETNNLYSIEFTDNYEPGFENIYEQGENNPFNMYHVKGGHSDDNETSEFGMGLKWASIFLGKELIVYTRTSKNEFLEIVFNFVDMMNKLNPIDSFKPQRWNYISETEYMRNHRNLSQGSTIVIKGIHTNTYLRSNLLNDIQSNIQATFGKIIKNNGIDFQIWSGGINQNISLIEEIDIFDHPTTSAFKTYSQINIKNFGNSSDDDEGFIAYVKTHDYTGKIVYNRVTKKHKLTPSKGNINSSVYESNYDPENDTLIEFTSTNMYYLIPDKAERMAYISKDERFFGRINVYRMNRKYDVFNFRGKKNNGSQNYTYHQLDYKSKKVNKFARFMSYNKTVNREIDNTFTDMIIFIQKVHEGKYNTDTTSKTFKTMEDHAKKNGFIPVPEPVIPDPPKPVSPVPPKPPSPIIGGNPPIPVPIPVPPDPVNYFLQGSSVYFINKKDKRAENKYLLSDEERLTSKFGITDDSPTKRMGGFKEYELQYFEELKDGYTTIRNDKKQFKALVEQELFEKISEIKSVEFEKNSREIFTYLPCDRFLVRDTFLEVVKNHRP